MPRSTARVHNPKVRALANVRQASSPHQKTPHDHSPAGRMLQMQRTAGNQAVLRLIQRLPTSATVKERMGKTKRSWRIGHGSTKYKAILAALDTYQDYIGSAKLDRFSYVAQFQRALALLNEIDKGIKAYGGKTGKKADYFTSVLAPGVWRERETISQTAVALKTQGMPPGMQFMAPSLAGVLLQHAGGTRPKEFDQSQEIGSDKGGTNEVTKFNTGGGNTGFFKQEKESIKMFGIEDEGDLMSSLTSKLGKEKGMEKFRGMQNDVAIGVEMVGIDPNDPRMANRDVAMARLDQLLGTNLIARSEIVKRKMPDGESVMGSMMEGAKGKAPTKLAELGLLGDGPGKVKPDDPTLMRMLSKLQLIDLIAFQADRNLGNYFIQTDDTGKVTGITGIDNDFSMGTNEDIGGRMWNKLPQFSRYVDKEMAEKILAVDLSLMEVVMAGLLTPAEIKALVARFKKVQDHLRDKKTILLEPKQWDDAVYKGLLDEDQSYTSNLQSYAKKL